MIFKHNYSFYSYLKLSTGFDIAAFIAWKLTVANAISIAIPPERTNIHQPISILYAKFFS